MSISIFSVLKMVPWGEVISKAPEIADGARKLWKAVAKKQTPPETQTEAAPSEHSSEAPSLASLQTQLATAEARISDLHTQMLKSTELIEALADQNAQLVKRLEANRIRTVWLTGAVVVLGIVTAITLVVTLSR
jgi:septal ring factor EnvC (AmiA/AmiB activator)